MIDVEDLTYRIGSRTLFDHTTLSFPTQGKIGLVGHNGCGKTTLFRLILGKEEADGGAIVIRSGARLVCVQQEIEDLSVPILEYVLQADQDFIQARDAIQNHQTDALHIAEWYDRYQALDGASAEARAATILSGLGFSPEDLQRPLKDFSGGWRVRASLAATLFAPSDCLLLDEPTNHLDLETAIWLQNYLERLDKMIIMISHEKEFLNHVCNYIVSVYDQKLHLFKGNYDVYVTTKETQTKALLKNIENQEKIRDHLQAFVDRFGAKATKAKQAQSRVKMIEKMEIPPKPSQEHSVRFSFPQPFPEVDKKLITLENVAVGYNQVPVLSHLTMDIQAGDKIALLGANGNGKSTMAKLLSGRLLPLSGTLHYARNLKIAYFSQQQAEELDVHATPLEMIRARQSEWNETQARSFLGRFGITQARGETPIAHLSGGEKSRVLLALNALFSPHVMIFDEPTNHLDIDAREALVEAINAYDGAIIMITHDFFTLSKTCRLFFIVAHGKCERFRGTLEDYRQLLLSSALDVVPTSTPKKPEKPKLSAKDIRKQRALVARIEKEMDLYERKKAALEEQLSHLYSPDIYQEYQECSQKLQAIEKEWFQAMDDL